MNEQRRNHLKEIARYSKEQILEALGRSFVDLENLLTELEYVQRTEVLKEHNKAIDESNAAFTAYTEWYKKIIEKCGDGTKVRLFQIPTSELQRGVELEEAWKNAQKKEQRLDAKVRKLLDL